MEGQNECAKWYLPSLGICQSFFSFYDSHKAYLHLVSTKLRKIVNDSQILIESLLKGESYFSDHGAVTK